MTLTTFTIALLQTGLSFFMSHLSTMPQLSTSSPRKLLPGTKNTNEASNTRSRWTFLRRLGIVVFLFGVAKVILLDIEEPLKQLRRADATAAITNKEDPKADPAVVTKETAVLVDAKDTKSKPNATKPNKKQPEASTNGTESDSVAKLSKNGTSFRPALHLIGERHTGTNWIYNHLVDCFAEEALVKRGLSRFKHWFQDSGNYSLFQAYPRNETVVVAQFRNPYHWVEAMREFPYHSPDHFGLDWQEFVIKPWTMPRRGVDIELAGPAENGTMGHMGPCQSQYRPDQVNPCHETKSVRVSADNKVAPMYELCNDGSGKPFASILGLRAAKIRNFMSVADFDSIQDFFPVQYEQMTRKGTAGLIANLEKALGVKAHCKPVEPQEPSLHDLPPDYVEWMKDQVDWKAEALVGYDATMY